MARLGGVAGPGELLVSRAAWDEAGLGSPVAEREIDIAGRVGNLTVVPIGASLEWLGTYVWGSRRRGPLIALDEVDEDALIAGAERHDDGLIVPCHAWIRRVDHVSPE